MQQASEGRRKRVLSGMRPTGMLHLGHYFLLEKWVQMQEDCDCNFFVADYHALTTASDRFEDVSKNTIDMIICWLAAGIDPERSTLFVQSQLREHAELHLILSMVCPLPWLERVPHYKDISAQSKPEDINYGFLGYPVLQAADIVAHSADYVPVGDDQEAHVELTAKLARSFNNRFGKSENWEKNAQGLEKQLKNKDEFQALCKQATTEGNLEAYVKAGELVYAAGLSGGDTQILLGWIEKSGREILKPPQVMKAHISKLQGLDGAKMSKSLSNDIGMLEDKKDFEKKIKHMPTDPARIKRDDPGDPEKCPVWEYHKIFSSEQEHKYVCEGCTTASIGCIDCKGILSDNVEKVIAPLKERAQPFLEDTAKVEKIIMLGNEKARDHASKKLSQVRSVIGLPQA